MPQISDKVLKFISDRYFFVPLFTLFCCDLHFQLSKPTTSYVTGGGAFKAVDLIAKYPNAWNILKTGYIGFSIVGIAITADLIYRNIFIRLLSNSAKADEVLEIRPPPYPYDEDRLQMIIGLRHERLTVDKVVHPSWVIVDEKGMYQNFLITGTIGTGKTASAMYPFSKQAMGKKM